MDAACPVRPWDPAEMKDQRRNGVLGMLGVPGYVGCTWVSISTRYVVEELERCYVANEDDSWSSNITNGSIAVTV